MSRATYHYPWQNPYLRKTIYPLRDRKLRDFLEYYFEIEELERIKSQGMGIAEAKQVLEGIALRRGEVEQLLNEVIDEIEKIDKLFKDVREDRRNYYVRKRAYGEKASGVRGYVEEIDDLEKAQKRVLSKISWRPGDDQWREEKEKEAGDVQSRIDQKSDELEIHKRYLTYAEWLESFPPEAEQNQARQALNRWQAEGKAKIPLAGAVDFGNPGVNKAEIELVKQIVRWKVFDYVDQLNRKNHDQLLTEVVEKFKANPQRFPKWLQYMVIHFSGMRYKSAHGSWADPKDLLQRLKIEEVEQEVEQASEAELPGLCSHKAKQLLQTVIPNLEAQVQKLEKQKSSASVSDEDQQEIQVQINNLNKKIRTYTGLVQRLDSDNLHQQRRAYGEARMAEEKDRIEGADDDQALDMLKEMKEADERLHREIENLERRKAQLQKGGQSVEAIEHRISQLKGEVNFPTWMWSEIVARTRLRLEVDRPDWETLSEKERLERWSRGSAKWREIMFAWENQDITAWRKKHAEAQQLIVTRAVCNEVAEHIQHLRGVKPPGGLTAKPKWYLDHQKAAGGAPVKKPLPIEGPSTTVKVIKDKTVCQVYKKTNKSGVPIMKPHDDRKRATLLKEAQFNVSTSARVTWKDPGDGVIIADGGKEHYLITDCPSNPHVIRLFVKKEDVKLLEEPKSVVEDTATDEPEPAQEEVQMLVMDQPYFRLPRSDDDFKTGASLLWLRWVDSKPNPWRIAYQLNLSDGDSLLPEGAKLKGGRRAAAAKRSAQGDGWVYEITSDNALRRSKTERVEEPKPLNPGLVQRVKTRVRNRQRRDLEKGGHIRQWEKSGLTDVQIDRQIDRLIERAVEKELQGKQKFRIVRRTSTQWLRWYHEATVVEVADMVDGTSVITFETATPGDGPVTATIGVTKRSIYNYLGAEENKVFVGYVPEDRPPNLDRILDWERILSLVGVGRGEGGSN